MRLTVMADKTLKNTFEGSEEDTVEEWADSAGEHSDSGLDNYGVFHDDYEFKFVQEGTEKTTLVLPQVTYDSMAVNIFNIEIEVDNKLEVGELLKEVTNSGTKKFILRIVKHSLLSPSSNSDPERNLAQDESEETVLVPHRRGKKKKSKKAKASTNACTTSESEVLASDVSHIKEENVEENFKSEESVNDTESVAVALDGTIVDKKENFDEYFDLDEEDGDGDDDFEEMEIGENDAMVDGDDVETSASNQNVLRTPKQPKKKAGKKAASTGKKRKYDKSSHYSKESENFTLEKNEEGERIFQCVKCTYTSRWPGNMRDHVRRHTGEKPFKCETCEKRFTNQSAFTKHTLIHSADRPHACTICGFSFKIKRQLVRHYRRHVQPGNHECPYCHKLYYSNSELQYHLPTHTGEKKYKCNICQTSFTTVSSLSRHKATHGGGMYNCEYCGHTSSRKEYWRNHMIKVHNISENDEMLIKRGRQGRIYDTDQSSQEDLEKSVQVGEIVEGETSENQVLLAQPVEDGEGVVQFVISF